MNIGYFVAHLEAYNYDILRVEKSWLLKGNAFYCLKTIDVEIDKRIIQIHRFNNLFVFQKS
jgi:hypothetical protein